MGQLITWLVPYQFSHNVSKYWNATLGIFAYNYLLAKRKKRHQRVYLCWCHSPWLPLNSSVSLLQHPTDVDYRVMATFTEFYTTLLGFLNFKLYHSLNLFYPPKVAHQLRLSIFSQKPPELAVFVKLCFIVLKKMYLSVWSWTAQQWIWRRMSKTMPWPRKAASRWVFGAFTQIGKACWAAFVK